MSERQQIVVEDVLEMLADGKTREEIQAHYGLNGVELKKLFMHEQLKGRRTHKVPTFEIVSREDLPQAPYRGEAVTQATDLVAVEEEEAEEAVSFDN